MIVEHINEHSGITSPIHRDSRTAPPKGRLRFRKAIYGAMQGNSLCQIVRQYSRQGAFDPVSDDPAHDQGRSVACKQCMGQKVQCCPCREGRSASAALGANEGKLARNRINNAAVRAISLLVVFRSRGLKNIICTEAWVAILVSFHIRLLRRRPMTFFSAHRPANQMEYQIDRRHLALSCVSFSQLLVAPVLRHFYAIRVVFRSSLIRLSTLLFNSASLCIAIVKRATAREKSRSNTATLIRTTSPPSAR